MKNGGNLILGSGEAIKKLSSSFWTLTDWVETMWFKNRSQKNNVQINTGKNKKLL